MMRALRAIASDPQEKFPVSSLSALLDSFFLSAFDMFDHDIVSGCGYDLNVGVSFHTCFWDPHRFLGIERRRLFLQQLGCVHSQVPHHFFLRWFSSHLEYLLLSR